MATEALLYCSIFSLRIICLRLSAGNGVMLQCVRRTLPKTYTMAAQPSGYMSFQSLWCPRVSSRILTIESVAKVIILCESLPFQLRI